MSVGEILKPDFVFWNKWSEFHMCYNIHCILKVLPFSFVLLSLLLFTIHMILASHQWTRQIPHHSLLDWRLNQHGATATAIAQSILRFKNSACFLLFLPFSQKPLIKVHLVDHAARLEVPESTTKTNWVPLTSHFTSPGFVSPTCKGLPVWSLDTLQTNWASGTPATCRTGQLGSDGWAHTKLTDCTLLMETCLSLRL